MANMDRFDSVSPADYRYWDPEVIWYLSENGFTRYKLKVEMALATVLYRRGFFEDDVLAEIQEACDQVTTQEVYDEEARIRHDIRALVNCIRAKLSDSAKPFIHMTATSYDIVDTANAARYKDVTRLVLIPELLELEKVLIQLSTKYAKYTQVGRTHGQHAIPITFGFALDEYVNRLGDCILSIREHAEKLVGKFSGAVGAYNASRLFFEDPEIFEAEILTELGLEPADHSTQIVPPEPLTRLLCEITITAGVLANLSDDMRHLQRTEISEVGEEFEENQVGSSAMPHKHNPITFEKIKSLWKVLVGRVVTVLLDLISEHQRDLTNSASSRCDGELISFMVYMAKSLTHAMKKLQVDDESIKRNLFMQKGLILAEPLQLMLSALGHPNAHEKVRKLTMQAIREGSYFNEVIQADSELKPYLDRMSNYQRQILANPALYTGIAAQKTIKNAQMWAERLGIKLS